MLSGYPLAWSITPTSANNGAPYYSRGWGVLCLDPRSFKPTSGLKETFGCDPVPRYDKNVNLWDAMWDITRSREDVTDSSIWHPSYSMHGDGEVMFVPIADNLPLVYDGDDDDDDEGDDGESEFPYWEIVPQASENQDEMDHDADEQEHATPYAIHDAGEAETLAIIYATLSNIYDNDNTLMEDFSSAIQQPNPLPGHQPQAGGPSMTRDFADQLLKPHPSTPLNQSVDPQDDPDFPVLYSTERHICLLQTPTLRASTVCCEALEQNIPPHLHWFDLDSRLNMIAQIPDLSLAVVGSQSGRVALLSLTTSPATIPDERYAFRLEAILPFKSQERDRLRPDRLLVGLAVAPIQGREFTVDQEAMTDMSARLGGRSRSEAWRR
ncbi:hypothetical protein GP486_007059, partial [Trichoglossum hirsutum]